MRVKRVVDCHTVVRHHYELFRVIYIITYVKQVIVILLLQVIRLDASRGWQMSRYTHVFMIEVSIKTKEINQDPTKIDISDLFLLL